MTILLLAALLPPLFLMIKIYKLDKVEKEPGGADRKALDLRRADHRSGGLSGRLSD